MDMFPPYAVRHNPADIELVRQVTVQQFLDWLIQRCNLRPGDELMKRLKAPGAIEKGLSPLLTEMREGESLWLCQNRIRRFLNDHEGIALVREGKPLVYIQVFRS